MITFFSNPLLWAFFLGLAFLYLQDYYWNKRIDEKIKKEYEEKVKFRQYQNKR